MCTVTDRFSAPTVFSPEVLDVSEDDLVMKFASGLTNIVALSLAISFPTITGAPHMFINAYKNVMGIAVATEYSYPQAEEVKEYLKDPSKFAAKTEQVAVAASGDSGKATKPAAEESKGEDAGESEDEDGFGGLFDYVDLFSRQGTFRSSIAY